MRIGTRRAIPVSRQGVPSVVDGFVSPAGWDADGHVRAGCIVTDNGVPFFVLPGGVAEALIGHLRQYVSVTGRVERRGGVPYIQAGSVVPIPDPDGSSDLE